MAKDYSDKFSVNAFWKVVRKVGRSAAEPAVLLFYAMDKGPLWAKTIIISALGYLVCPIDAVPDIVPVVGFADDAVALTAALGAVSAYITDDVKKRADEVLENIFG